MIYGTEYMTAVQEFGCEVCGLVTSNPIHWFVIRCGDSELTVQRWNSEAANAAGVRPPGRPAATIRAPCECNRKLLDARAHRAPLGIPRDGVEQSATRRLHAAAVLSQCVRSVP